MNRRNFIKQMGASALFVSSGSLTLAAPKQKTKHITILHTNDTHSHIEPFPLSDARNPGKAGVARRAALIEQIRKENPYTLLLDAGDIFQGTPYFNFYGGEIEFKLMSMLGYDAATIGNHDLDNGLEGLYKQLPHAHFPFICSNYDFTNTILHGKTKPYKVFKKNGVRIGVYGLGIELKGLVDKNNYKETQYLHPQEIMQDMERTLKFQEQCDLIICLSHLGYQYKDDPQKTSDLLLAQASTYTHLFIGGHTHTFLPTPTRVKNKIGADVLVNQVGCFGINLGRIDFYLDDATTTNGLSIEV